MLSHEMSGDMTTRNDHHHPNAGRLEGGGTRTEGVADLRALPFNPVPWFEPNV